MIDNIWFCEPNDARESWCFFAIKVKKQDGSDTIAGWEICFANPNRTVRKVADAQSDEKELLKGLLHELYYCRKNDIKIITFETNTIPILRTRIIFHDIHNISFRSLQVISIQKLLQEHLFFGEDNSVPSISDFCSRMKIGRQDRDETELLHDIFKRIGPLLPPGVIE
jgi:hypothetical protein